MAEGVTPVGRSGSDPADGGETTQTNPNASLGDITTREGRAERMAQARGAAASAGARVYASAAEHAEAVEESSRAVKALSIQRDVLFYLGIMLLIVAIVALVLLLLVNLEVITAGALHLSVKALTLIALGCCVISLVLLIGSKISSSYLESASVSLKEMEVLNRADVTLKNAHARDMVDKLRNVVRDDSMSRQLSAQLGTQSKLIDQQRKDLANQKENLDKIKKDAEDTITRMNREREELKAERDRLQQGMQRLDKEKLGLIAGKEELESVRRELEGKCNKLTEEMVTMERTVSAAQQATKDMQEAAERERENLERERKVLDREKGKVEKTFLRLGKEFPEYFEQKDLRLDFDPEGKGKDRKRSGSSSSLSSSLRSLSSSWGAAISASFGGSSSRRSSQASHHSDNGSDSEGSPKIVRAGSSKGRRHAPGDFSPELAGTSSLFGGAIAAAVIQSTPTDSGKRAKRVTRSNSSGPFDRGSRYRSSDGSRSGSNNGRGTHGERKEDGRDDAMTSLAHRLMMSMSPAVHGHVGHPGGIEPPHDVVTTGNAGSRRSYAGSSGAAGDTGPGGEPKARKSYAEGTGGSRGGDNPLGMFGYNPSLVLDLGSNRGGGNDGDSKKDGKKGGKGRKFLRLFKNK
ncbi:hypothetical protein [Candidatus Ichthyocystis sparus]|uniref:hypothetical protein n=1 Tax=Candidatus Ichthyocystis sparus TaxID=1561004 RepID=UPI000AD04D08|nr:hypothetical protein [Candidatus Ichthyocystis sparus]